MKKKLQMVLSLAVVMLSMAFIAHAQVASNPPYTLEQTVIASGGGTNNDAGGNTFSLTGAIGQSIAGTTSRNSPFSVSGGFFTASPIAPTAAGVTIEGRARTANGGRIRNVLVTLTETNGTTRTVLTGVSGRFRFTDVAAGQTIILNVSAKRFNFGQPSQVFSLTQDATEIDFVALDQLNSTEIIPK